MDSQFLQALVSRSLSKFAIVPGNEFVFAVVGDQREENALLFLGPTEKDWSPVHVCGILFTSSLEEGKTAPVTLQWEELGISDVSKEISYDEKLRRHRMRKQCSGIAEIIPRPLSTEVVLLSSNMLYVVDLEATNSTNARIPEVEGLRGAFKNDTAALVDPSISPCGRFVTFIRGRDIFLGDLNNFNEWKVTDTPNGVMAGVAEYIAQEEFDRYTAKWWAPDGNSFLYLEVDERKVLDFGVSLFDIKGSVSSSKYPVVASPNVRVNASVCLLSLRSDGTLERKIFALDPPLSARCPQFEYVVRAGWINKERVFLRLLNREQSISWLVLIDLKEFCGPREPDSNGAVIPLRRESDLWINMGESVHIPVGKGGMLISEEITGHSRLYLLEPGPGLPHPLAKCSSTLDGESVQLEEGWTFSQVTPFDDPDWDVVNLPDCQVVVEESRRVVFFGATKESVLDVNFYCGSFDDLSRCKRLTDPVGFSHAVKMNASRTRFVSIFSSIKEPPRIGIFSIKWDGDILPNVEFSFQLESQSPLLRILTSERGHPSPELFSFLNDRQETVHGLIHLPEVGSGPFPTILHVYGGPHVQTVANLYARGQMYHDQVLREAGFAVVRIDGRGSGRRGVAWEKSLKHALGRCECLDQIMGLEFLAAKGLVDMSRVGCMGWSYGGYLSLMLLAKYPSIFRVAVSGSPVVSWEGYDTAYSERYLGLLPDNADVYEKSSILPLVQQFPDEEHRLLLIGGILDENVHFSQITLLISKLVELGKPYDLKIFVDEYHGIRKFPNVLYLETSILSFVKCLLRGNE